MAKRQRHWARRKRRELLALLGNACALCGKREHLTFDCILPMDPRHHHYDASQQISFYRRQLAAGNLQILCNPCNARKSNRHPPILLTAPL